MLLSWLSFHKLYGQCYWDNNKGINTPLGTTINNFDWTQSLYYVYTSANQTSPTQVNSPMSGNSNPNDNIFTFTAQAEKHLPAEGWELLIKNFGSPNDPYPFPTLALYNRYLGIIRTFIYVPEIPNFSKNTARISIQFFFPDASSKKESAFLSPLSNPQFAVDNFAKKLISNTVQRASYFGGQFWMYADFPVSYDPCSCNHFTSINIKPLFINVEKVDLTTSTKTANVANGGTSNFADLTHAFDFFAKGIEAGNKKGVAISTQVGTVSTFFNTYVLNNFDTKKDVQTIGPDDTQPTNISVGSSFKIPDFIKTQFGTAGTFLGLVEYFMSGGKSTAMSSSTVNYNIGGTITDSIQGQNTTIYVPGSTWTNSSFGNSVKSKPIYNNTLGVFGLLETPKSQRGIITSADIHYTYNKKDSKIRVKLDKASIQDLKYAINPSSNLIPISISASLVVKASYNQIKTNYDGDGHSKDPRTFGSVSVLEEKPIANFATQSSAIRNFVFVSPTMSFDCLTDYVMDVSLYDANLLSSSTRLQLNITLKEITTGKLYYNVAQYKLNPDNIGYDGIPVSDFSKIPINVNLSNLNLTSDITIKAWQNIKVSGTVNTNGFKLNLISGANVDIDPISVSPGIDIQIKTPADCGERLPLSASNTIVNSFCGTVYNPTVPFTLVGNEQKSLQQSNNGVHSINAQPNPFSNQLSIDLKITEDTETSIELSNNLGQIIRTIDLGIKEKGIYQESINTSDLPSGIYFITLRTPQGIETKKLVKE